MKKLSIYIGIAATVLIVSCKKYLDKKPDKKLVVPVLLNDFQSILNRNELYDYIAPELGDLGCDDYYLSYSDYQFLLSTPQNCYTWETEIFQDPTLGEDDWAQPYNDIYLANVVLDGLKNYKINSPAEQIQWSTINGHALFLRGMMHYFLEETFGQPYKTSSAGTDLGIPLKLEPSLEKIAARSNVRAVFDQIVADLEAASNLLPATTTTKNWPSKATAFAMLARVYLSMQNYQKAGASADSSLHYFNTLYDYNNVPNPTTNDNPFSQFTAPNDLSFETLYPITKVSYGVFSEPTTNIDTNLYNSYNNDDLRKVVYFSFNSSTNTWYFKGNYSFSPFAQFAGPAVDEMYLTRAECYARAGNTNAALSDLNTLMIKRWEKTVLYPTITATDAEDALRKVLTERRKELIFRGTRWIDLRRLNQDPRFAVTLTRVLNGQTYTLPPNDKKYTLQIPPKEIQLSGIQQNPR